MRCISKVILIILLLSIPVFAQEQAVYIAASGNGKKYHYEDCRTLRNSEKKAISIPEAKQRGYTPCGVCKPGD